MMICPICKAATGSKNAVFCANCGFEFPGGNGEGELLYASFWRRLSAFWIDIAIMTFFVLPLALFLYPPLPSERKFVLDGPGAEMDPLVGINMFERLSAIMVFTYIGFFFYHALTTSSKWQGSVGKLWLGMKVVDPLGRPLSLSRAALREACRVASIIPIHLGFLWVLLDRQRRGFHDMLAGTYVVRTPGSLGGHPNPANEGHRKTGQ